MSTALIAAWSGEMEERHPRSEIRTGVLAMLAIALVTLIVMALPRLNEEHRIEYAFRIPSSEDLTGLRAGTIVQIGGINRGHVLSLRDEIGPRGALDVLVRFEIDPHPPIFPGAKARVVLDPISQLATIDFFDAGEPGGGRHPLAGGSVLSLADAVPDRGGLFLPGMQEDVDLIADRVRQAMQEFPSMGDAREKFEGVRTAFQDLRHTVGDDLTTYRTRILALIDRYRAIGRAIEHLLAEIKAARGDFDAIRAPFGEHGSWSVTSSQLAAAAQDWADSEPDRERIAASLHAIRAGGERVRALFQRLRARVKEIVATLEFDVILADASLTSTFFSKLTAEVTADPLLALIPAESSRSQRRNALDEITRRLLNSLAEARETEAALRALQEATPAMNLVDPASLREIEQSIENMAAVEEALRTWRSSEQWRRPDR